MKILDNKRKIMGSLREKNAMKNVSFERKRVFFFCVCGQLIAISF